VFLFCGEAAVGRFGMSVGWVGFDEAKVAEENAGFGLPYLSKVCGIVMVLLMYGQKRSVLYLGRIARVYHQAVGILGC